MSKNLLFLLFSGCCYSPTPSEQVRIEVQAPMEAAPVQTTAPAPAPTRHRMSDAFIQNGTLMGCYDVVTSNPEGASMEAMEAPEGWRRIPVPCAQMFADRIVLASCVTQRPRGSMSLYYYHTSQMNDSDAISCVEGGGVWNAISRDSHEYRRVRLAESTEDLQKASRDLQRSVRRVRR